MSSDRYFKKNEAELFSYIRVPKYLFTLEKYKKMSPSSKLLYGLLRDRISLSDKNNWIDENNNIYIIYTRIEACDDLNISKKTCGFVFKELVDYDLLIEKRQGLNKPNLLYDLLINIF